MSSEHNNQKNVYDLLKERGFVSQATDEERIRSELAVPGVNFYIGFDPTADSLHVGHLLLMLAAHHLQIAGHNPFILLGGGTSVIGDPSGRTNLRKVIDKTVISHNISCLQKQLGNLVSFEGKNAAKMINNADWLLNVKWIEFLQKVGVHFSINKMLAAEVLKLRLKKGLLFSELSYMLMQAYDFFYLFSKYGVNLQIGGSDQWFNIIAGIELVRKICTQNVVGFTLNLLTNPDGTKMGKSAHGALWLEPQKTSPYHFYQHWLNVDDSMVEKYLLLFTLVDVNRIKVLVRENCGKNILRLKKRLAFAVTEIVHGKEQAVIVQNQSVATFQKNDVSAMYTFEIKLQDILSDFSLANVLVLTKQANSKTAARRLICSNGVVLNGQKIVDISFKLSDSIVKKGEFTLAKGKKNKMRVVIK